MFNAIRIKDILRSSRLSLLSLSDNVPLSTNTVCSSCDATLRPVCVLTNGTNQKIRYGLCEKCGYMTYIDRPTKDWLINFYSQEWDKAYPKSTEEIEKDAILPGKGIKLSRYLAASLITTINPSKEKTVCEIGSGYGEVLKYLKTAGFKKLIGIENSMQRANLVRRVLGLNILHGEFENPKIQEVLTEYRPLGLVFSHHVLEHVYDPNEVIRKISLLQDNGDYLILSLPNADGEHINYALLYLVHLHSFTKESLELLLNKHGYEIIADNSPDNSNIIIAARKTPAPKRKFQNRADYFTKVSKRIRTGFCADQLEDKKVYRLYWKQDKRTDYAELLPPYLNTFFLRVGWYFRNFFARVKSKLLRHFDSGYTMLIAPEQSQEDIFKIVFDKKIKFLVK